MRLDGVSVQQIVLALVVYFFDDDADAGCDEDAGHMMPYRRHQTGMQHPTRKNTSSNVHARTQNALVGETPCELTVQEGYSPYTLLRNKEWKRQHTTLK